MVPPQILAIDFSSLFCNVYLKILILEEYSFRTAGIFVETKYSVGGRTARDKVSLVKLSRMLTVLLIVLCALVWGFFEVIS